MDRAASLEAASSKCRERGKIAENPAFENLKQSTTKFKLQHATPTSPAGYKIEDAYFIQLFQVLLLWRDGSNAFLSWAWWSLLWQARTRGHSKTPSGLL
jgi:hypothetical protein